MTAVPPDEHYHQPIRNYAQLSREELERRLSLAEDVVMMFSWTGVDLTDRGKAAHELWRIWRAEVGDSFVEPVRHPHLRDDAIRPLVVRRDRARERTLADIKALRLRKRR